MDEVYVSVDIECDGPCPGLHSMLSIGAAVVDPRRGIGRDAIVATYTANLDTVHGAKSDPDTIAWWRERPREWDACRANTRPPEEVMPEFARWLDTLGGPPIFVGYPASFDFTWVYYYLHRFAGGHNPFVRNAIDIETVAMAVLGTSYLKAGERAWPEHWFDRTAPATHVALDDAISQGLTFLRILNHRMSRVWGAGLGQPDPCPVCQKPGGALTDGPHTYSGGCSRRRFA